MNKIYFCILFFLSSCASLKNDGKYFVSEKINSADSTIAVLPVDNASTDLDAEKYVREEIVKFLLKKGYNAIKVDVIDDKLREMGINDGGQLKAYSNKDLSNKLQVRNLLFVYIDDYSFKNLGYVIKKNVKINVKMIDSLNDEVLYEAEGSGSDIKFNLDKKKAEEAFLLNTGVKLAGNITNKNLALGEVTKKAVSDAFKKLPSR